MEQQRMIMTVQVSECARLHLVSLMCVLSTCLHACLSLQNITNCKRMCKCVYSYYLGRGMDPDGRVEQNVVTQLLEQQDAILQVAQVSGKGQHNVQDGPRHVYLGRLEHRRGDRKCNNRR